MAISDTIFSLFDISKLILAARFCCFCIDGFTANVYISIQQVLVHVHAIFVFIANIQDDCFLSGNGLLMLLATMNSIVLKVVHSVDELLQSIQSLEDVTIGSAILASVFEAVVHVAVSVIKSVAFIFAVLMDGSHLVELSMAVPGIMLGTKVQIFAAKDRLHERLEAGGNDSPYNAETFTEASLIIDSFNTFKHNIADIISDLDCNKGNDTVDDASTTKVDIFIGNLKSFAAKLSRDGVGKEINGVVDEICNNEYDVLIQLSTLSFGKGEVLSLMWFIISNFYFATVTLSSIFNCVHYGVDISVF